MATLAFTALGSLLGPIGGAVGALVGQQFDNALIGGGTRQGPRLKELAVTTSSYGAAIPRLFGRMRVAGSIIWATDLVEHRDKQGGGKGRPAVKTYSYTASFAVALASRPISGVGRIWADGNLLRGAADDLKVGGTLRIHTGEHDQPVDPLIAAAEGEGRCPAFRGLAYVVVEDLDLADFGNRIPALTFEVLADDTPLRLADLLDGVIDEFDACLPLAELSGFACDGPLGETLAALQPVYPLDCDASAERMTFAPSFGQSSLPMLPDAAIAVGDGDFGGAEGHARQRGSSPDAPIEALRYYDLDRDYQPGLQRAPGAAHSHHSSRDQSRTIDLPGTLTAAAARALVTGAARRAGWSRDTLHWRTAELDPAIGTGTLVAVPREAGSWKVDSWEWRESGVELLLVRQPPAALAAQAKAIPADPGRVLSPVDLAHARTVLAAFELPWDGAGRGDVPAVFAAVSSSGPGWSGAALFADRGDGALLPLGPSGRARAVIGTLAVLPAPVSPHLLDRTSRVEIDLVAGDLTLDDASVAQLALGANQALLGSELIQFARAVPVGGGRWRLDGLLRGRGGTEAAIAGHRVGEHFVLLDGSAVPLDPAIVGSSDRATIAALGLGDAEAASVPIALPGATLRPLAPVHPRATRYADGALQLTWTRRARGAWSWSDGVDAPLNEQAEKWHLTYGANDTVMATWETAEPNLTIAAAVRATLEAADPANTFAIRQRGTYALSEPLTFALPQ